MHEKRIPYPHPEQPDVYIIPLTQGYECLIDADDLPLVGGMQWFARVQEAHRVYAVRTHHGRYTPLHRFVMNAQKGEEIDHISRDTLDNRKSNLRRCTRSQNIANARLNARNSSGYRGVSRDKRTGRWIAQIQVRSSPRHIGVFDTPLEAALAYDAVAREAFGEFAFLNFPD